MTFVLGFSGILLILGLKKINKSIPGPLVAVILGIIIVTSFQLATGGLQIVGSIPEGLPELKVPSLSSDVMKQLMTIAVTISLIGFMESIAVAKAVQRKHKNYKISANQELIGLGLANIGGSFVQSFPTTGGFFQNGSE